MDVLAYVSGHGFGHWTRTTPLLEHLAARGHAVHVRTNGRALGPARRAPFAASVEEVDVGPGAVQRGPLEVDVPGTRAALEAHLALWPRTVASEVARGRALGVGLVLADGPPVAFEVARRLEVPGVASANFTWSWIYEGFAPEDPAFLPLAARVRWAEGLATHVIGMPGGGGLDALGARPERLLALRRVPTCSLEEARARLPRPRADDPRPVVLISFGGYGDALDLSAVARDNPRFCFVSFAPPRGAIPDNLALLPHDHSLPHQDLVYGADAVVGKPGYGTISECMNRPTPFVAVSTSGAFREHGPLAEMMRRWLPTAPLALPDLEAGRWTAAIEAAMASKAHEAAPPNGLPEACALLDRVTRS